ncbi:hypothetical protein LXL04_007746 [Taraxacum kok-saghyz]
MVELKFYDTHNIAGYLLDPPAAHREFQSMIDGLNQCRISNALRMNPAICKNLINDFWKNASVNKQGANEAEAIESTVRGTALVITKQTIREVLEFSAQPSYQIEYLADQVLAVLKRMGYEGKYPSTLNKLLPPY